METKPQVRCRFAPSPTGMLHVGGARTALFNYLFAKANAGKYLLRIEDSDQQRSTPEALDAILKGLEWLGIVADEELVFQSRRTQLYLDYVKKILAKGLAYPCDMSAEELDLLREDQKKRGEKPRYDARCRPKSISPQPQDLPTGDEPTPFVIRMRMPETPAIDFEDGILGRISTPMSELDDFILIRSDGTPTYNLVNAVDDIEMNITHVLRGNEHVANTPKQIAIYQALDADCPIFAHFPLILGPDKKKLSKRHGATAVFAYRDDGYLSNAFVNYLARLGWSHGDTEIFSIDELKKVFSLKGVGKSPSVFDIEKLRWVNSEHIQKLEIDQLKKELFAHIENLNPEHLHSLEQSLSTTAGESLLLQVKQRARTLVEIYEQLKWLALQDEEILIPSEHLSKFFKKNIEQPWNEYLEYLESCEPFNSENAETEFSAIITKYELGFGKLAQPIRLALTANKGGASIFTAFETLGRERTISRLKRIKEFI